MKKVFFRTTILVSFTLIVFSLIFSGCGSLINMEGVELSQVEKVTRDTIEEEKDIKLTPEGSLAIGSFVRFGEYQVESEEPNPILWKVIENKSHYKGNVNPDDKHMTLLAENIIDLRGFDAKEPQSKLEFVAEYGNSRYIFSNLRQWFNSSKKANSWWEPQYEADAKPNDEGFESITAKGYPTGYEDKDGFLNSFSPEELGLLLDTTLECGINKTDGGGTETVTDKVFLLSLTEVGLGEKEGKNYLEGNPFAIFNSPESRLAYLSTQCFKNTKSIQVPTDNTKQSWEWWLRSPYSWSEYDVWAADSKGGATNRRAYKGAFGLHPSLNIKYEGLTFSGSGTIDDPYVIK